MLLEGVPQYGQWIGLSVSGSYLYWYLHFLQLCRTRPSSNFGAVPKPKDSCSDAFFAAAFSISSSSESHPSGGMFLTPEDCASGFGCDFGSSVGVFLTLGTLPVWGLACLRSFAHVLQTAIFRVGSTVNSLAGAFFPHFLHETWTSITLTSPVFG